MKFTQSQGMILKEKLKGRMITQQDLARRLQLTPGFISKVLNGYCRLPSYRYKDFCQKVGLKHSEMVKQNFVFKKGY